MSFVIVFTRSYDYIPVRRRRSPVIIIYVISPVRRYAPLLLELPSARRRAHFDAAERINRCLRSPPPPRNSLRAINKCRVPSSPPPIHTRTDARTHLPGDWRRTSRSIRKTDFFRRRLAVRDNCVSEVRPRIERSEHVPFTRGVNNLLRRLA